MPALRKNSEKELIFLLKQGSSPAFEEIYLRYNHLLYLYAYRKLQNKQEAQDVVQEVFTALWNGRMFFDLKITLSGYLYKAVLNKIYNIFKHQQIIRKYVDAGDHFMKTDYQETDHRIREKDIQSIISQEIAAMPPRMREIYELKRNHFLTTREVAERLNLSEQTVSTQMKRALRRLRLKLGLTVWIIYLIQRFFIS